jgi:hypothetical protein
VIQHLESVLVDQDRDVLAGMSQADPELLAAAPALTDDPLDGDRSGGRLGRQAGHPGAPQPVPLVGRDRDGSVLTTRPSQTTCNSVGSTRTVTCRPAHSSPTRPGSPRCPAAHSR